MINCQNQNLGVDDMERKTTDAQLAAVKKYDSQHMAWVSVKAKKELIEQFKAIAASRGEKVNTLLKDFVISYIEQHKDEI